MSFPNHVETRPSPIAGNGLFATKPINDSDLIVRKTRPLLALLDLQHAASVCAHCFAAAWDGTHGGIPQVTVSACTGCRRVRYCSKTCQATSWKRSHRYECKIYQRPGMPPLPTPVRAALQLLLMRAHGSLSGEEVRAVEGLKGFQRRAPGEEVEVRTAESAVHDLVLLDPKCQGVTREMVEATLSMLITNSFTLCHATLEPLGMALDPLMSTANHSCDPNAYVVFDGAEMSLRSYRPIEEGEEITVSYIEQGNVFPIRQEQLKAKYGFVCQCPRCNDFDPFMRGKSLEEQAQIVNFTTAIYSTFNNGAGDDDTPKAIRTYKKTVKMAQATPFWPIHQQPVPNAHQALLARSNEVGDFATALLIAIKIYFVIDPLLYPKKYHINRVVHTWTLLRLLMEVLGRYQDRYPTDHAAATKAMRDEWGIEDFAVPIWRIFQDLKLQVQRSHGRGRLAREIAAAATEFDDVARMPGQAVVEYFEKDPMGYWKKFERLKDRELPLDDV